MATTRNLCSMSWNVIATVSRRFKSLVTVFQKTSTSPIPWKSPLVSLGINTAVYHMHSLARFPSQNAFCAMATTFYQLVASGVSSQVAEIIHWWRSSALIPDGPPEWLRQSLRTAQEISSSSGIESSTRDGCNPTVICCPGGGTCRYSANRFSFMVVMATLDGVRGEVYGIYVTSMHSDP